VNSGTREKDIAWITQQAKPFSIDIQVRDDLAMVALQGPTVRDKISHLFPQHSAAILQLKPFHALSADPYFIARTGYTGEEGFEIILPATDAENFWNRCVTEGIQPCGLGARDTLRLEAGLNLYGSDMDESVTPLESNLAWTVQLEPKERDFIGRNALEKQLQAGVKNSVVGLVLDGPGVLRNHQKVITAHGEGEITSGSFSPTLSKGIALARVPSTIGKTCHVDMRGKSVLAHVIKPPFVRQGKKAYNCEMERENE
jgi:aminomethyltransferase